MNKKILIIICTIVVIGLTIGLYFVLKPKSEDKKEIENIVSFHFSRTTGWAMNSSIRYSIDCDKTCIATIKPDGISEEEAKVVDIDNKFLKKLEKLLNKYDVISWDGFDKNDPDVLDGNSFSLSIKYNKNDTVSASGYMMWPDNYKEIRSELDDLFNSLYEE